MSQLISFDETGKITCVGVGPSDVIAKAAAESDFAIIVDQPVSQDTHYVKDGTIVEKPKKPSDEHTFDYATKQWVRDLEELRPKKLREVHDKYGQAVSSGFSVGGSTYSTTKEAQDQIQLAVTMQQESAALIMQDGSCTMVNAEQAKEIGAALLRHLSDCIQRRSDAVAAVKGATSVSDLDKVVF